jgi:hypothetical protein
MGKAFQLGEGKTLKLRMYRTIAAAEKKLVA